MLVLTGAMPGNPFSRYVLEILDVEGFAAREVRDLGELGGAVLTPDVLDAYDAVLLANADVTAAQQQALSDYVERGGRLVALRPPRAMAACFGLHAMTGINQVMADRYVSADAGHALMRDFAAPVIQFCGDADLYRTAGAEALAWLGGDYDAITAFPAVTTYRAGRGAAAAFTYDLAACVVRLHQGRRENSSVGSNPDADRDDRWIPNDLFVGQLDSRLKLVPQADVHQDLLVRVLSWLTGLSAQTRPVPRLWYFPNAVPCVAWFNGDSDGMDREHFLNVLGTVEKYGGKYTCYLMEEHHALVSPEEARELRARGHSLGHHVILDWLVSLEDAKAEVAAQLGAFRARYDAPPLTNRGHCLIWPGWTEMARFLAEGGVRMDQNFIPRRYLRHGYLNGSALPVKFMDERGALLDVYEQNTQLTDDGSADDDKFLVPGYDRERMTRTALGMLDDCADRYHGVFQPSFHPRQTTRQVMWLLEALLAHCWEREIPMVGGDEWVYFNDARREVSLRVGAYDAEAGSITYELSGKRPVKGLTLMVPARHAGRRLAALTADGVSVGWSRRRLKGTVYGLCSLDLDVGASRTVTASFEW